MRILGRILRFSALAALVPVLSAQTLNLSSDFVNRVKNRATLSIQFELDKHLTAPHPVSRSGDDGDVHMAGRAPEVKLPMVVEIMNAGEKAQAGSVNLMNSTPAGQSVAVTGAWRIWFEHPSQGEQTQGDPVEEPGTSNPNHVFEIHPVTSFGGMDIGDSSLVPIESPASGNPYNAYSANDAFGHYEKLEATVEVSDTAVSISSKQAGFNYTEFMLEPAGQAQKTEDGVFVLANVYDTSDDETPVTAAPRRMVFIANTAPAKQLLALPAGGRMHVLGIPRVNLAEVAAVHPGEAVDLPLPYEMIIVAVMPEEESSPTETRSGGAHKARQSRNERKP